MANVFSRSWQITKLSLDVIKKDKEMLWFPILSGIFSILFIIALLFPTIIVSALAGNEIQGSTFELLIVFLIYLGLAFIATFFNVATVYTAKTRFEGKDATFMDSIKFAFSKIGIIFLWSVVSAVVGVILYLIEKAAENSGQVGEIVLTILRSILGAAWSIMTTFVIPILVYKGHTPFKAIKESTQTLKKTWGESLVREFGLGLIQFLLIVLVIIMTIVLVFLTSSLGNGVMLTILGIGIIVIIAIVVLFNTLNNVYNTALYHYAETGKVPHGFSNEVLAGAFEEHKNN